MSAHTETPLPWALKAVSRMLAYPEADLQAATGDLARAVVPRPELNSEERSAVRRFLDGLGEEDLLDLQAAYVETFDRSKKVSLYLFEHVYGESRDRGPAMVELKEAYREAGLEIACGELPDYLPMFLEFCAELGEGGARDWLEETGPILQQLHVRLVERDSRYAVPLRLLLRLAELDPAPEELVRAAEAEERDDTPEAHDRAWMEAPVTFGPDQPAGGGGQAQPVQWVDRDRAAGQTGRS
ncbi:hypothetical protein AN478_04680 [Thiohalorhabdus denitrificans]|uniref:Respiratory nitrate reductase chaperone NarJ n=1 Tax=Thiohalorhabdus denitrificans TaxID=381306 RepID=A0A0P9C887_9GAMM|nr:nitrate reductase molybdenum cofactor assembly chaperone [Thiohalorhabdus denitrificans]KPV41190.1 hypothetical protein AN478_04680 [Thiohalorhabdus denitrificans]SCY35206.1 respiratory nitrate reductase chaperone NarJ [Thiohalorhabdus denitrificans]